MSRIMIDIDGCVGNYVDAFRDCVIEERGLVRSAFPPGWMGPAESWNFYKQPGWDMTTPEFLEAMRYAIKYQNLFYRLVPYDGAIDGLHELKDKGHTLVVVSSRTYGPDTVAWALHQTKRWLEHFGAPEMKIILTSGADKKSDVCKEEELTIAIEDSPDNWEDLTTHGIECFLMTRAWNTHVDTRGFRVETWAEFVKMVS